MEDTKRIALISFMAGKTSCKHKDNPDYKFQNWYKINERRLNNLPKPEEPEQGSEQVKSLLSDMRKIANNTLYFADNSDYREALFDILNIVTPGGILNEDGDLKKRLNYIDD